MTRVHGRCGEARSAAVATGSVVQLDTGSARGQSAELALNGAMQRGGVCSPPTITFQVPAVVPIGRIADPVARNQAINQSYHAFDGAMSGYLGLNALPNGEGRVSNWCTYGQHASREAGTQIRNLDDGLRVLRDSVTILASVTQPSNPVAAYHGVQQVAPTLRRMSGLLQQPGLMQQSFQLALTRANITPADLRTVGEDLDAVAQLDLAELAVPGVQIIDSVRLLYDVLSLTGRLAAAVPAIIEAVGRIHGNMISGNRQIYDNIAPAYQRFLTAGQATPDGSIGAMAFDNDPSGFLSAAFQLYAEVRGLVNRIACLPAQDPSRVALLEQRNAKAHQANLLIGFQEQLVILQPIFDTMQDELRAMSGTMVLNDPNGAHRLTGNWGDFYTRMGIDPSRAPADPRTIRPNNLPALRDQRRGTIAEYFEQGLNNDRIHNAPRGISHL